MAGWRVTAMMTALIVLLAAGCGQEPKGTPQELLAMGRELAAKGQTYEAVQAYAAAIDSGKLKNQVLMRALLDKALVQVQRAQYDMALADMSQAMEVWPGSPDTYRDLAWLLATCPSAGFRDGQQALVLADKALTIAQGAPEEEARAASLAELSRFGDAVASQEKAVALWREQNSPEALKAAEARLKSYRQGKPWRQP